ncbi:hypothetical protein Cadr_000031226, partial [Camelus dromedarius]
MARHPRSLRGLAASPTTQLYTGRVQDRDADSVQRGALLNRTMITFFSVHPLHC